MVSSQLTKGVGDMRVLRRELRMDITTMKHCHAIGIWLSASLVHLRLPGIYPDTVCYLACSCFCPATTAMEKKEKQSGSQLLPVLLVCMLLACAGLVFAVYTHKQLCWLKTQIREHEKLIQTLQLSNNARDIQVGGFFSGFYASLIYM